jgi:putative endonuclease
LSDNTSSWFVYLLRCSDNSIYTGITINLKQRLHEHNHNEKGAKYTRGRRPVKLVYQEQHTSRSKASQREYQIKQMKKLEKEQLINDLTPSAI